MEFFYKFNIYISTLDFVICKIHETIYKWVGAFRTNSKICNSILWEENKLKTKLLRNCF